MLLFPVTFHIETYAVFPLRFGSGGWHITCTTRRPVLEFDISSFDVNQYIKIVWKQPYKRSVLFCALMSDLKLTPGNDIPWIFSMMMRIEAIIHKSVAKMATAIVLKSLTSQLDSFSIHSCYVIIIIQPGTPVVTLKVLHWHWHSNLAMDK